VHRVDALDGFATFLDAVDGFATFLAISCAPAAISEMSVVSDLSLSAFEYFANPKKLLFVGQRFSLPSFLLWLVGFFRYLGRFSSFSRRCGLLFSAWRCPRAHLRLVVENNDDFVTSIHSRSSFW